MRKTGLFKRALCIVLSVSLLAGSSLTGSCSTVTSSASGRSNKFSIENEATGAKSNYVTFTDLDSNHKIDVKAPANYSTEDVLKGIKLENVSAPIYTSGDPDLVNPDLLTAEGGKGHFQISVEGGFRKGNTYEITLNDSKLTFDGQDDSIRIYNLKTKGDDVSHARLNPNIQFVSLNDLSKDDAKELKSHDSLYEYDATSNRFKENKFSGSFTAQKSLCNSGDIVAVYEGEIPDDKTLEDGDKSVSYLEITKVNKLSDGNAEYSYESADQKDIIFTPDVIPVKENFLFPNRNGEKTLSQKDLDFSSKKEYAEMGLDENTQIDVGDYLAFYTGDVKSGKVTAYAEITEVTQSDENVTVKYNEVSMDEMVDSMDMHRETMLTEEQIRNSYDEEEVKAGIINDLNDSGMLTASTYELAESVLDTEDVKEAFGDVDVKKLHFYFGEDESISLSGKEYMDLANGSKKANSVDVKGDADVMITPNIVHFAGKTGYGTGIRAEAYAKYVITIRPESESSKAALKINLVFFFETELVMGFTVDATAVWKFKWIFPYISDYSVTGSYADGIYVGAGFTTVATLIKNEKEKTEEEKMAGLDWPSEEIDKTPGAQRIMKIAEYVKEAGKSYDKIFPAQDTGGGSLAQKYASFAKAANTKDWVDILDQNIFDWNGSVLWHIIAFRIKADFVVSAELHVAIGTAINYENAYIENFNFLLFSEGYSAKHTENNSGSNFRMDDYLFGAVGIRAGLRVKMMVGLIDARLDGIGLILEGGLYGRLWGLLYGGIEITDVGRSDWKDHVYFAGGFLADTGAYYEVTFVAELADGQISYKKVISSGEYPFFQIGTQNITTDFAYQADDVSHNFTAKFDKNHLTTVIPKGIALMNSMDMKTGTVSEVNKANTNLLDNYEITFDDDAFSYKYENGNHYLVLDYAQRNPCGQGTVTMNLKWKGSAFEFNTDKIQRKIKIDWTCDMNTITFLNKDGSVFHTIQKAIGAAIGEEDYPQAEPKAYGYTFRGWCLPGETEKASIPSIMPEESLTYEGIWERNPASVKIEYLEPVGTTSSGKVEYFVIDTDVISEQYYVGDSVNSIIEDLSDLHLIRTDPLYNYNGKKPLSENYSINYGDSTLSCKSVAEGGTTTFKIALKWDQVTVTYDFGEGQIESKTVGYYSRFNFPEMKREGKYIAAWQDSEGNTYATDENMWATKDETYTAIWEEIPTTLTVDAQVKETKGIAYMWKTVKLESYQMDCDEILVSDIIDMLGMEGYTFAPSSCAYELDSVIAIHKNTDTKITLRFTKSANEICEEE